ncbi:MAG: ATP-binding protein [Candidatus Solibacter sp.]
MRTLRDTPIRKKLIAIVVATLAVAILLAGFGIMILDGILFRTRMVRDFSALTKIVADLNTATLSFDDPQAARETLMALKARPHVVQTCLFRTDGTELAQYSREVPARACSAAGPTEEISAGDDVTLRRPVMLDGRQVGTVLLTYDRTEVSERRLLFGAVVLGTFTLASLLAFLLTAKLRGSIELPISNLAHTAAIVAETRNYQVRAEKVSDDELGLLTGAFNEMLSRIQLSDRELRRAAEELEARVAERTRELETELAERRRAEEALNRQAAELARSNADLQQFAYVASHDLQEPLRMVFSYMNLIAEQYSGKLDAEADEFIGYAVDGARRMRQLITDLLEYSRVGSRDQVWQPTHCDKVLQDVRANLSLTLEESRTVLTSSTLPVILAEPAQVTQLFQNLIANGIKFRGSEPPRIHVTATREGEWWKFSVADNGIGIDPAHHQRIFIIFQRLHDRTSYAGTGIGLAICNKIVNRLGGRIWVESEAGGGATFYFTIPAMNSATGSGPGEFSDIYGRRNDQETE